MPISDQQLAWRALAASRNGVVIADAEAPGFPAVWANPAFEAMTGYTGDEITGLGMGKLQGPESAPAKVAEMAGALREGRHCQVTIRNYRKDGAGFWNDVSLSPLHDGDGLLTHYIGILDDVTAATEATERAQHLAHHDVLTGLPNRAVFLDRVRQAMARLSRRPGAVAVLFLDIDDFKFVNESHSHLIGDELLRAVPARLGEVVRRGDTLARIGGDEFALLYTELSGPHEAAAVAQRILDGFRRPFTAGGEESPSAPRWASRWPATPGPPPTACSATPARPCIAPRRTAARASSCSTQSCARVHERLNLARDLRRAIAQDELTVHYQPIVALETGAPTGFEALLRWNHPERGPVPPGVFIPIAEETGSIVELGRWVLKRACSDLAEWSGAAGSDLELAINLSARQLVDQGLQELIGGLPLTTGFDLGRLSLEVTETALHREDELPAERLWALKELGVGIHLDDFGSGYSSLGHLRRFPIDVLKVDRSFVAGIGDDSQDAAIVAAILPMAAALGLDVIAEGVETSAQAAHLLDLGCRRAQGFLFGRPAPAEELPPMAALSATS
ncbi:MAG TPA: EAL domain-containing protein [Thermoleophilaceae bacterium]|nr:EAL domain-containing protein [Thermoleophilaceae bacterium]